MNEFDFIDRLRQKVDSRTHSTRIIKGIGDDGAVIRENGNRDLIITTDLLIEGVDFHLHAAPPNLIGHKALAVSLSDIAAMGARPSWSLLSFGLPPERWNSSFRDDFIAGYLSLADQFGVTLSGGDISASTNGVVIDSIVLGEVESGSALTRSGARAGDQIYVTGNLGGAAAGLKLIELGARIRGETGAGSQESVSVALTGGSVSVAEAVANGFSDRSDEDAIQSLLLSQLRPEPRVGWGIVLGEQRLATAMIDISDGLSSDLHHLCRESNVGALLDASAIPLNHDVRTLCGRRALDPLALALHGGEDFELLFTVAAENISRLPKKVDGVTISRIGEITSVPQVRIKEGNRVWDLLPQGYEHFSSREPD
jgi:thiamine-monophosphate kinase